MTAADDDERIVTDLLKAIDGDAGPLRPALLELRSLAHGPVPVPSPELADLLVGSPVVSLAPRRRARAAIFSLAVVAAMGVGTTAAAALSPEFRTATQHVITGIVGGLTPGATSPVPHTPTPEPSTANGPVRPTTTHPTPHPTPTDSLPPQTPGQPNGSSPGHPGPLIPVKPVPPVVPSQKDHTPGIPPTPGIPATPQKSWTNGMIPGIYDGVPGAK
jgi:hypothetical protein